MQKKLFCHRAERYSRDALTLDIQNLEVILIRLIFSQEPKLISHIPLEYYPSPLEKNSFGEFVKSLYKKENYIWEY